MSLLLKLNQIVTRHAELQASSLASKGISDIRHFAALQRIGDLV